MTSAGWEWMVPEPQDRIDFIFYKSSLIRPLWSITYNGYSYVHPKPYHYNNDYPSDHYAVITNFAINFET